MLEILIRITKPFARRLFPESVKPKLARLVDDVQNIRKRELEERNRGSVEVFRAEIDRVKNHVFVVDGKINTLVYGLPSRQHYQAQRTLRAPIIIKSETTTPSIRNSKEICENLNHSWDENKRKSLIENISNKNGKFLALGIESIDLCGLLHSSEIVLTTWEEKVATSHLASKTKHIQSDFLTETLLQPESSLDGVIACHSLQQLMGQELPIWIEAASRRLKSGGFLWIELPNLNQPEIRDDLYWANPRNLRPYSAALISKLLEKNGMKTEIHEIDSSLTRLWIATRTA